MASLRVVPSSLEVDFDKNLTSLYQAITDQDWDKAVAISRREPKQAATWVVRHYEADDDDDEEPEIMWRFLPLHSACARQPPASVVSALIRAYPDGPMCIDDQGMYAIHYACGNQAARDVIRQLLAAFPGAAKLTDPRGMLPIHYLVCWGPSAVSVVDMLLLANREIANAKDDEGNTPLDLAIQSDYSEKQAVINILQKWLNSATSFDNASRNSCQSAQLMPGANSGGSRTSQRSSKSQMGKVTRRQGEEEKKEEVETNDEASSIRSSDPIYMAARMAARVASTTQLRPFVSPDEYKRMQEQIRSLESAKSSKEREWEKKFASAEHQWKNKNEQLSNKCERQEEDLMVTQGEVEDLKRNVSEKNDKMQKLERELKDAKSMLDESRGELKGLRLTLGDLMDQHEGYKKKSGSMNDRLGSLAASLDSMMEQQNLLTASIKERSANRKSSFALRQAKLQEIMELEQISEEDEDKLEMVVKKQNREMEAIAAVIAAARE